MSMNTLTVELSDEVAQLVEETARKRNTTPARVAKQCIEAAFKRPSWPEGVTVHDLAKDLIGRYSGPGDLATNPRHMDDFGK